MTFLKREFSNLHYKVLMQASVDDTNARLDHFIRSKFPSLSRELIKKKIKNSEIRVLHRNLLSKPSTVVKEGDHILMLTKNNSNIFNNDPYNQFGQKYLSIKKYLPQVILKTNQFLAISKPPLMLVHPTGKHLFNCVTTYFSHELNQNVYGVHRIDKETSGLLLLGLNKIAASTIGMLFENHQIQKTYFLIGKKITPEKIQLPVACHNRLEVINGIERMSVESHPRNSQNGKLASTHFEEIYQNSKYLLALAFPKSGRQHQIRVHARDLGFPLIGDKIYLKNYQFYQKFIDEKLLESEIDFLEIPRQALHAYNLRFALNGRDYNINCPLPQDLLDWISDNLEISVSEIENIILSSLSDKRNLNILH